ncbi:MAG: TIGR04086 family membrane protein [Clostridiales bacterium]|jgi:putative membrane protein (TIGR04086 family)|uniref:TIGR04086 family membrane protein n=1 Tax=Intestinimonas massiliensis (ex Afouda et al. 2020) TaxID=1673721 RepID=A0AAW5JTT0_9FIRM|nr:MULTISPECIES: TIGR04086 family membrane protein [Intestinimonas]MBS6283086.1 TIGR04086 family membrane protein [Oscillospiraceae bacterium]MDU1324307.1 TIGR04086 family membrane protein [Clostridiales bacterium]CUQ57431.1 putative membrane protein [Flavonifractor plautii]SCJ28403.1 putative membrane protein [uncultured Flavonifractor sp.]MCG4527880.1 TIGR04086 family membrane protein [Intestinimonas massiliensis (ex Afouda et al. 2020)]
MRKTEEDQGTRLVRAMTNILLGGVVALAVCLMFLFLCSIGISGGWLQEGLMYQMAVVSCVIGGFAGAMTAVRRCGSRALIVGLAVGAVFFLLLLTVGVLLFESMSLEAGGLGLLCGGLCGGAAAGLMGSKPKKKRRKK